MKKFKITKKGNVQITLDEQTFRNLDGMLLGKGDDFLLADLWVRFGLIHKALDEI